jgi:hypothetical protein
MENVPATLRTKIAQTSTSAYLSVNLSLELIKPTAAPSLYLTSFIIQKDKRVSVLDTVLLSCFSIDIQMCFQNQNALRYPIRLLDQSLFKSVTL